MWILKTLTDDLPESTFRILDGGIRTVGRATGADFIVEAALVSRVHCRLTALPHGELEVRDLESTNGTFVNGQRVAVASLTNGDRLRVGRIELLVIRDDGGQAQPPGRDEQSDRADAPRAEEAKTAEKSRRRAR